MSYNLFQPSFTSAIIPEPGQDRLWRGVEEYLNVSNERYQVSSHNEQECALVPITDFHHRRWTTVLKIMSYVVPIFPLIALVIRTGYRRGRIFTMAAKVLPINTVATPRLQASSSKMKPESCAKPPIEATSTSTLDERSQPEGASTSGSAAESGVENTLKAPEPCVEPSISDLLAKAARVGDWETYSSLVKQTFSSELADVVMNFIDERHDELDFVVTTLKDLQDEQIVQIVNEKYTKLAQKNDLFCRIARCKMNAVTGRWSIEEVCNFAENIRVGAQAISDVCCDYLKDASDFKVDFMQQVIQHVKEMSDSHSLARKALQYCLFSRCLETSRILDAAVLFKGLHQSDEDRKRNFELLLDKLIQNEHLDEGWSLFLAQERRDLFPSSNAICLRIASAYLEKGLQGKVLQVLDHLKQLDSMFPFEVYAELIVDSIKNNKDEFADTLLAKVPLCGLILPENAQKLLLDLYAALQRRGLSSNEAALHLRQLVSKESLRGIFNMGAFKPV